MGLYSDHILPRGMAFVMGRKQCRELRPTCVAAARGRVLELGFGAGHNVPHYTREVTELVALDPSKLSRKLSAKRVAAAPFPVEFVGLDGADIPLEDGSIDAVVSTWTLCSISDGAGAMGEITRVLRPGGSFHFLEHGLSSDPRLAQRQRRFNGLQMRLCGGCRLDVDIGALVRDTELDVGPIDEFLMDSGPKVASYLYRGVATRR